MSFPDDHRAFSMEVLLPYTSYRGSFVQLNCPMSAEHLTTPT